MAIEFNCPECNQFLRTKEEKAGKTSKCPHCSASIRIPGRRRKPAFDERRSSSKPRRPKEVFDPNESYTPSQSQYEPRRKRPQNKRRSSRQSGTGFAIASLVCGVISVVGLCVIGIFGFPITILAVVLGIISKYKNEEGQGMALAGIICGSVMFVIEIALFILYMTLIEGTPDDPF